MDVKEKSELVVETKTIKNLGNNDIKEIKSNWNDSLVEFDWDSNDYYKRFKDNDSYNDYVINMKELIGVKDEGEGLDNENNFLLERVIFEK